MKSWQELYLTQLAFLVFILGLWSSSMLAQIVSNDADRTRESQDIAKTQLLWQKIQQFRLPAPPPPDQSSKALAVWGKQLFDDPQLSKNGEVSCASCHQAEQFFTDGRSLPEGLALGQRHTPTIINSFAGQWFFWDGRADSLAAQALQPLENPSEHGLHRYAIVHAIWQNHRAAYLEFFPPITSDLQALLSSGTGLATIISSLKKQSPAEGKTPAIGSKSLAAQRLKQAAEGFAPYQQVELQVIDWQKRYQQLSAELRSEIDQVFARVGIAIAAFEKTIVSGDAPIDKFIDRWAGLGRPEQHLTKDFDLQALQGLQLFVGKAQCVLCHHGPYFTDGQFHHVGFPQDLTDRGRKDGVIKLQADIFGCESPLMLDDPVIRQSAVCQEKEFIVTDAPDLVGAFKTPSLRHVAQTAPYGHAGQFSKLSEVLEHYNNPINRSKIGTVEASLRDLQLNKKELLVLEKFLNSLSSEWLVIE